MRCLSTVLFGLLLTCAQAHAAWWNADWSYRKKITLDTSDKGAATKENLGQFPLLVRLHTGNFAFSDAKEDGSDLRFVADDDKTPLKHHIESYDSVNELALVWVQVPRIAGGNAAGAIWLYYGNKKAPAADDAKGTYDSSHALVMHFGEKEGVPEDATAYAHKAKLSEARPGASGQIGRAAAFDGKARIVLPAAFKVAAGGGFTFSAWVKSAAEQNATLYAQQDGAKSITVALEQNRIVARVAGGSPAGEARGGEVAPGTWRHLAVVVGGGKITLYVDGSEAGTGAAATPELAGELTVGAAADGSAGFRGEIDELQVAAAARPADWIKLAAASQAADSKVTALGEDEQTGGAGHSYFGILVDNLTVDAWVVIVILMAMLVASFVIMIFKALHLMRTERANAAFLEKFADLTTDLTSLDGGDAGAQAVPNGVPAEQKLRTQFEHSTLFQVYHLGVRELRHRIATYRRKGLAEALTPQAVNAIRASLDAGIVRENARLNSRMVLLTIAISGGPFLGLLGTVVGVMITFAAIAAQGDVNVNAIAPGIAAALLATVAGLAVAIPCLFGYNWLASRIKGISAEMQVFADELLTKFAESYSG